MSPRGIASASGICDASCVRFTPEARRSYRLTNMGSMRPSIHPSFIATLGDSVCGSRASGRGRSRCEDSRHSILNLLTPARRIRRLIKAHRGVKNGRLHGLVDPTNWYATDTAWIPESDVGLATYTCHCNHGASWFVGWLGVSRVRHWRSWEHGSLHGIFTTGQPSNELVLASCFVSRTAAQGRLLPASSS